MIKCIINGKRQWCLVVVDFENESFLNGKAVNVLEYAKKQEGIIKEFRS